MLCKEIMKIDVECCGPDDNVGDVSRTMRDNNVGFLPVCDENQQVLGTLTDRDIVLRVCAEGRGLDTHVEDCMTREVVSCLPDDDIRKAEQLMADHHKSRILCCDDGGRLVGVISLSDLAQREDERQVGQTLRRITEREAPAAI